MKQLQVIDATSWFFMNNFFLPGEQTDSLNGENNNCYPAIAEHCNPLFHYAFEDMFDNPLQYCLNEEQRASTPA